MRLRTGRRILARFATMAPGSKPIRMRAIEERGDKRGMKSNEQTTLDAKEQTPNGRRSVEYERSG